MNEIKVLNEEVLWKVKWGKKSSEDVETDDILKAAVIGNGVVRKYLTNVYGDVNRKHSVGPIGALKDNIRLMNKIQEDVHKSLREENFIVKLEDLRLKKNENDTKDEYEMCTIYKSYKRIYYEDKLMGHIDDIFLMLGEVLPFSRKFYGSFPKEMKIDKELRRKRETSVKKRKVAVAVETKPHCAKKLKF